MAISKTQLGWMALGSMVCLFCLSLYSITRENAVSAQDPVQNQSKESQQALARIVEPETKNPPEPIAPPTQSTASPESPQKSNDPAFELAISRAVSQLTAKPEQPEEKKGEEPRKITDEGSNPKSETGGVPAPVKPEEAPSPLPQVPHVSATPEKPGDSGKPEPVSPVTPSASTLPPAPAPTKPIQTPDPVPMTKSPEVDAVKVVTPQTETKTQAVEAGPKSAPAEVNPLPVPEPIGPSTTPATPLTPLTPATTAGSANQRPGNGGVAVSHPVHVKTESLTRETPIEGEPPLAPRPGPVQTYHVRHDGETIREIARKTLGSNDRCEDIVKLNPSLKPDSALTEGVVVRLPAEACFPTNEVDIVKPLPVLRKPNTARAKVLPLTGTFPCNLDDKRTIALPKAIRDQLGNCDTVMVSPGPDQCLWLTNQAHLDRLADRLENSPAREVEVRVFKRLYYAQTERVTVSGDGHIQVSDRLAQFAGLDGEVVLIGIDDHFELWDVARWKQYTQQQSNSSRAVSADQ